MNLKKAKKLRLLVKQLVAKGVVQGEWSPTQYKTATHPDKLLNTGKTDEKGNPVIVSVNRTTRHVDPMSPRGVYRRMKKNGIAAVLQGHA